ncbi:MAG: histidine kinase N-terminal domain-containing protein, partial [Mycobacterium sp.]
MSTLGDLLAEHTIRPGNAVDHLHAVVGEWQLLADLSFGDLLMWVRRDDGALVCVAQCRPNTASTLLVTDAVGSVVAHDGLPGAIPVRYRGEVVATLTRQSAGEGRRTSSPLERAYSDCAAKLLDMVADGAFP